MSTRKLQQEFDKTNKKIAEGLSVFDDIYDKLMTTEISSQKEKLESDLKKEIKKLQRLRDQLKTWLGDSSIKLDKNPLQENRTKIEHAMDQFKDLEKLSKIKQFSNEGLELQSQKSKYNKFTDPENAKRQEASNYVSEIIEQIGQQNESLELELHLLTNQLKKSKASNSYAIQSSIDDCKYKVERNNSHLERLETVLKNLENEKLNPDKIDQIKDDLEYYVENNQDEDYVEYDDFYDQLEVEDEDSDGALNVSQSAIGDKTDNDETETDMDVSNVSKTDVKTEEKPLVVKPEASNDSKSVLKDNIKTDKQGEAEAKPGIKDDDKTGTGETSIGTSSTKKVKPAVIPAPNPPPLSGANSYSTVIKAAQAAASTSSAAKTSSTPLANNIINNSVTTANTIKSRTASPQLASQKLQEDDSGTKKKSDGAGASVPPETPLPVFHERKPLVETASRLTTLIESRLNNPLPFQAISQLLESSLLNCPDSFDAERVRQYHPISIHPSSVDYPQEPMYELNSSHLMKKFDNDTLFFCFYYNEGIDLIAKWNAAKELSSRGWLFNTDTNQWFMRDNKNNSKNRSMSVTPKEWDESENQNENQNQNQNPNQNQNHNDNENENDDHTNHTNHDNSDNPDKSNGFYDDLKLENYKYFDYEKTWLIRRKENYEFKKEIREVFN